MAQPLRDLLQASRGLFEAIYSHHASMRILLMGRDRRNDPRPKQRLAAIAERVEQLPSARDIEYETRREQSEQIFNECYNLEKELLNILISSDIQKPQSGYIRKIYVAMFHSLKSLVRIKYNNFVQPIFLDRDMKREFFVAKITADLKEAFEVACLPNERVSLVNEILSGVGLPGYTGESTQGTASFVPGAVEPDVTAPPTKWSDRPKGSRTNPADFVLNIYQPWIGRGLTRGDLLRIDQQLYYTLAKWMSRHPRHPSALALEQALPIDPAERTKRLGIPIPK